MKKSKLKQKLEKNKTLGMIIVMAKAVESYHSVCRVCLRMCEDESEAAEGPPSSPPSVALR